MGWNGNANFGAMNPYMTNGMFNFPNAMGMFLLDTPVRSANPLTLSCSRNADGDGPDGRKSGDVR